MEIRPEELSHDEVYRLLIGSVVPRPIAWVTSLEPDTGIVNVAPFSFFTVCASHPPMLCFAVGSRPDGSPKDTARNIRATGEFVVNVVTEELAEAANLTSTPFPRHVSELVEVGLTPAPSSVVRPPRIAESPINMECRLERILELGRPPYVHSLVIGEVVRYHARDGLVDAGGRVDVRALRAVGRLAGNFYCRTTGEWLRYDRLSVEAFYARRRGAAPGQAPPPPSGPGGGGDRLPE